MTQKALNRAEGILDVDVDITDEEQGAATRAQTSVISTILTTQAKVDENRLRRASVDRLPALLKLINETAARLPSRVIEHEDLTLTPEPRS